MHQVSFFLFFTFHIVRTHLHQGEIFLPPDVLGVHAHEIVGVHDGVDEAVQHNGEVYVPIVTRVDVQPVKLTTREQERYGNTRRREKT